METKLNQEKLKILRNQDWVWHFEPEQSDSKDPFPWN